MNKRADGSRCGCSGACCGEQTYGEMLDAFVAKYQGSSYTESELRQIHRKWRKIASQI